MSNSFYDIEVVTNSGKTTSMREFANKNLLIVNTASQCGYTKQYKELEEIYREYKAKDFLVLGFPCNQFGGQEPGSDEEIAKFCSLNYDVTFPLFKKIEVNGSNCHPLYIFLKKSAPGIIGTEAIKWNFTKFFVNKDATVIRRYSPQDTPGKVMEEIRSFLSL